MTIDNKRKWYYCPNCKKKIVLYEIGAESKDVFIKCRGCKKEIEIKID